ncbi:MAG: AlpA family phage regulatory protein [Verrucomicrobiaceae bacterium]
MPKDHEKERKRALDRLASLPPEVTRKRLVGTADVAVLTDLTPCHIRRLLRQRKFPRPIRVGARKLAWRLSDIVALTEEVSTIKN